MLTLFLLEVVLEINPAFSFNLSGDLDMLSPKVHTQVLRGRATARIFCPAFLFFLLHLTASPLLLKYHLWMYCVLWQMTVNNMSFLSLRHIQKLQCVRSNFYLWVCWRQIKAIFIINSTQSNYSFKNHLWRSYCQPVCYMLKLGRKITAFNSNLCGAHLTFKFILWSMTFL